MTDIKGKILQIFDAAKQFVCPANLPHEALCLSVLLAPLADVANELAGDAGPGRGSLRTPSH
jgi:hypothetical protein